MHSFHVIPLCACSVDGRTPVAGQYDEGTWQGYDFAMNEASKRGIRLVLVFANYWANYGGVDQYNQWSFQAGVGKPWSHCMQPDW